LKNFFIIGFKLCSIDTEQKGFCISSSNFGWPSTQKSNINPVHEMVEYKKLMCSSRAFQWMVMSVGFDILFFGAISCPALHDRSHHQSLSCLPFWLAIIQRSLNDEIIIALDRFYQASEPIWISTMLYVIRPHYRYLIPDFHSTRFDPTPFYWGLI
jgi:hypothetical protein